MKFPIRGWRRGRDCLWRRDRWKGSSSGGGQQLARRQFPFTCSTKKLILLDDEEKQSLLSFKSAIEAFAIQNKIEEFVIKTRLKTGLKSGGGITFKIETLFQLSEVPVVFLSPKTLTTFSQKSNLAGLPSTLKAYQHESYRAGAWRLSKAT